MASLVKQVNVAIESMARLGKKKTARKNSGKKTVGIYHGNTLKNYISLNCTFVKWAKQQYDIKYLKELNEEMCRRYFDRLKLNGRSAYTMHTIRDAIKKLEIGIKTAFHFNVKIVPDDLKLPKRRLNFRRDRFAYTADQVSAIIRAAAGFNEIAAKAIEVQSLFGLRKFELLNLRNTDIHFERDILVVWRGKGGRLREIEIPNKRAKMLLEELVQGIGEKDLIFPELTEKTYQDAMEKACRQAGIEVHKTHNLRHHYAVKKCVKLINNGITAKEARKDVSADLGHNRVSASYPYITASLLKSLKNQMIN